MAQEILGRVRDKMISGAPITPLFDDGTDEISLDDDEFELE
jgi:hypothetical protein